MNDRFVITWFAVATLGTVGFLQGCSKPGQTKADLPPVEGSAAGGAQGSALSDTLVLGTDKGLVEVGVDGKSRPLSTGPVADCMVDTRLDAVWVLTQHSTNEAQRDVLLVQRGKPVVTVSRGLDMGASGLLGVSHGTHGRLGVQPDAYYEVMAVLELGATKTRWKAEIGCGGMMEETCYQDDDGKKLTDAIQATMAAIEKLPVVNSAALSSLLAVAGTRALTSTRKVDCNNKKERSQHPSLCVSMKVPNVDAAKCAFPEMCGTATKVPGTGVFIADVHNERNDVFHGVQQFFDPQRKVYLHPSDPSVTSPSPHKVDGMVDSVGKGLVSKAGHWYAPSTGKVWSLKTFKPVAQAPKDAMVCGYWGGWYVVEPGL